MNCLKIVVVFLLTTHSCFSASTKYNKILKNLQMPAGFSISIYAGNVPNARTLALSESGVVYVGTRQQGVVYAVKDSNNDGVADKRYVIAKDLYMPNGVAYKDGDLYVAEVNRIIRFNDIERHLAEPEDPVVIYDQLPSDKHHGWKYLRFGKDGKLYTAIGAPCNICIPEKDIYSSLVRLNSDGSEFEILARGIRNTVGFDWQPETNKLFFTENVAPLSWAMRSRNPEPSGTTVAVTLVIELVIWVAMVFRLLPAAMASGLPVNRPVLSLNRSVAAVEVKVLAITFDS